MASPHTAGCMALLMSIDSSLTYSDLYDLLTTTGVDLGAPGFDFTYGYGRIDCYEAALLLEPDFSLSAEPETAAACVPDNAVYTINVGSISGFTDPVDLDAVGEPAGATINFSVDPVVPPGASVLTVGTAAVSAGDYSFDVTGSSTTGTKSVNVGLELFDTSATASLSSPANGATNVPLSPTFTWSGTGTSYFIEIATDAGFTNIVDSATTSDTSYTSIPLSGNTTYYWRVTADNPCGDGVSQTWSFTTATASLVCGATEGFETGAFPADWYYTTLALI